MNILSELHPDLIIVLNEAIKYIDFKVICGFRGEAEQNKAFHDGYSKLMWPNSKHNKKPALAVDIMPYFAGAPHIRYNDKESCYLLAGYIKATADKLGIGLRWGGNWADNNDYEKSSFIDLPHYELIGVV
jgi:peptidoglycan L-alanyl-D-glutamate endopeptidase CwlK